MTKNTAFLVFYFLCPYRVPCMLCFVYHCVFVSFILGQRFLHCAPQGDLVVRLVRTGASIPLRQWCILHIPLISKKFINFHIFMNFPLFLQNLRFLLPPILTMIHLCIMVYTYHTPLGKNFPTGWHRSFALVSPTFWHRLLGTLTQSSWSFLACILQVVENHSVWS